MKYDDASWHSGDKLPKGLPDEAGATHIGMFACWALLSGLAGDLHTQDFPEKLAGLRNRSQTPGQFFLESCDGKLTNEDLNDEGNAFARVYYDVQRGRYLIDYEATLGGGRLASLYSVQNTWKNFDRLSPILDRRLAEWRSGTLLSSEEALAQQPPPPRLWLALLIRVVVAIAAILASIWLGDKLLRR